MTIILKMAGIILLGGLIGAGLAWLFQCSGGTCPIWGKPWRGALLGGLIAGLLASGPVLRPESETSRQAAPGPVETGGVRAPIVELQNKEDFPRLVLQSEKPILLVFHADWCGPCQQLEPIIQQVAVEQPETLSVVRVNIDHHPELAREHQVRSIPHLIIFRHGQAIDKRLGMQSRHDLEQWIESNLKG